MTTQPSFQLVITADGKRHPSPCINRLRLLLKALLRAYGFRVVEAKEIEGTADTTNDSGT